MTDTMPTPADLVTWLSRSYGLSTEDAEKVIARVRAIPQPDAAAASPPRLNVMQTVEGVGDGQVTRQWVNVEAVTEEVVGMMTVLVAQALQRVMGDGAK